MRLYDPNEGLIQVGGINISAYSPAWIRSQFGVVNQVGNICNNNIRFKSLEFGRHY